MSTFMSPKSEQFIRFVRMYDAVVTVSDVHNLITAEVFGWDYPVKTRSMAYDVAVESDLIAADIFYGSDW